MKAGPLREGVQEQRGVRGQAPGGGLKVKCAGQFPVAEPYRLHVVHLELAQHKQPGRQRIRDRRLLVPGEGRLSRRLRRLADQACREHALVLLGQAPLLATEGDEA